jgi:hypothetical protein
MAIAVVTNGGGGGIETTLPMMASPSPSLGRGLDGGVDVEFNTLFHCGVAK